MHCTEKQIFIRTMLIESITKTKFWLSILAISVVLIAGSLAVSPVAIEQFEQPSIDDYVWTDEKYDLPFPEIYLDQYGLPLFSENVRNKQDFFKWKESVLNEINLPINKGELNEVILLETQTLQGYLQKKYSMQAFDGDTIIFYELLPTQQLQKIPTVFLIPGSDTNGTLHAIGQGDNPRTQRAYVNIGKELVKQNYLVFVIVNRGTGERSVDFSKLCNPYNGNVVNNYCDDILLDRYLGSLGISMRELHVRDSNFLLNYIRSLDYVDKQKIGIVGLSLGAYIAKDVSIINPEINAIVLASGAGTFISSISSFPSSVGYNFNVYPDEYALLAPRPLYLSWGEKEVRLFSYELETHRTADFLNVVYDMLDAKENLTVVFHEEEHQFHLPSVIRFLDEAIGP